MRESAGTLLYRRTEQGLEVLIVHPSGPYNRRATWSIPKGEPDAGEDLEVAARRETLEETGIEPGELSPLGSIIYKKSRKRVHCFTGLAASSAVPRCASWEVDRAAFVSIAEARRLLHPDQVAFIDRLEELVGC